MNNSYVHQYPPLPRSSFSYLVRCLTPNAARLEQNCFSWMARCIALALIAHAQLVDSFQTKLVITDPSIVNKQRRRQQYQPLHFNQRSPLQSREQSNDTEGSVAGASLLFAGTAIGAGMLALPAETMSSGFVPSIFGLTLCCIFTYVTSIIVLEARWLVSCYETCNFENKDCGGGFLLIARKALGVPGEVVTAVLFWFLLTAIIVAYTAEGGQLLSSTFRRVATISIDPAAGSLIFTSVFAVLAVSGTSKVDVINRIFVLGLVTSFAALVATGLPMIKASNLFERSDWTSVYPTVISIGILSFGAQNVVPTLFRYLNNNPDDTKKAIMNGTLIPLVFYTVWEAVFIGVIDTSAGASSVDKMDAINVLDQVGGQIITDFVELFSICAISSSMAGASVSLVEFFEDASKNNIPDTSSTSPRLFATVIALGPPVVLACAFPDIFLTALEEAGLLGGVSLYGILPAISVLTLRATNPNAIMPGRLGGGNGMLSLVVGLSSILVIPELLHLFSSLVSTSIS